MKNNGKSEAWQSGHFRVSENVLEPRTYVRGERSSSTMDKGIYSNPWWVYIARCYNGTLYVGIAIDVEKRIHEHNHTSKCRYTRYRKPLLLIYSELQCDYNSARRREKEIKRYSRKKKLDLIEKKIILT